MIRMRHLIPKFGNGDGMVTVTGENLKRATVKYSIIFFVAIQFNGWVKSVPFKCNGI